MVQDELKPNELLCNISSIWWDFAEDAAIFELLLSITQNPWINLFTLVLPEHFRIHTWKPFEEKNIKNPFCWQNTSFQKQDWDILVSQASPQETVVEF